MGVWLLPAFLRKPLASASPWGRAPGPKKPALEPHAFSQQEVQWRLFAFGVSAARKKQQASHAFQVPRVSRNVHVTTLPALFLSKGGSPAFGANGIFSLPLLPTCRSSPSQPMSQRSAGCVLRPCFWVFSMSAACLGFEPTIFALRPFAPFFSARLFGQCPARRPGGANAQRP